MTNQIGSDYISPRVRSIYAANRYRHQYCTVVVVDNMGRSAITIMRHSRNGRYVIIFTDKSVIKGTFKEIVLQLKADYYTSQKMVDPDLKYLLREILLFQLLLHKNVALPKKRRALFTKHLAWLLAMNSFGGW